MQQSPVLAKPVLVGRKKELTKLQRSLEATLEGNGTSFFISGVAGSGKTRLTNEFLNMARKKGVMILFGWCLSSSNVPYFPFIEAFSSYNSSYRENGYSTELSCSALKMVSYLSEPYGPETVENKHAPPLVWKDKAFLAVVNELLFMSSAKPLLLVLEDMHWADTASLALLHYLSRAVTSERIMILGTFRSEELSGEDGPQPLSRTLHLMGREGLFKEIKLANLDLLSVGKIAESMLGGPVDSALVHSMLTQSQGNPLFVVESIHMLAENGCLVKEQSTWQVKGKIGIPYKVREVILRRLEALKPEERRILDVAAVIGDKFDSNLIGSVLSIDSLIVLETLNKMFHTTFLLKVEDNVYAFDHSLSREVLYQEISQPLRSGYHERIAEKIENKNNRESFSINQLVFHYVEGRNKAKAIEYSIIAGKDALERYSNLEAIKHFNWVLQTISNDKADLEIKRKALGGLGDAFYASNAFKDAIKTYESLAEISSGSVYQGALVKAMTSAFFQGDIQRIDQIVTRAESVGNLGRLQKARILHYKGVVATCLRSRVLEAKKLCEESLNILEEEYSLSDAAWLLFVVADFASGQGEIEKAVAYCLRSLSIYDELGDYRSMMEACNETGKVFIYCGLYPEAQRMFERVFEIEQQTKMANYIMLAKANCFYSLLCEITGNLNSAIERNLKAIEYSNKSNSPLFLTIIYSNLVKQLTKKGEIAKAKEYDAKLKSIFTPSETSNTIWNFYYALSQMVLLAGQGHFQQSIEQFNKYLSTFRKNFPNPRVIDLPLSDFAWVLQKSGEKKKACEIVENILKTTLEYEQKFKDPSIKAYFVVPKEVQMGESFCCRLDVVNISRTSCSIEVYTAVPSEFIIVEQSQITELNQGMLYLQKSELEPFSVKAIHFEFKAIKNGHFTLTSAIEYGDMHQGNALYRPEPINITVKTSSEEGERTRDFVNTTVKKQEVTITPEKPREEELFLFGSGVAKGVFNFLTNEFIKDYMQRRLALEKAGWRTLVEIADSQRIPKSTIYKNRHRALVELEHRGLIEQRFFPGERGRGGNIIRLRISYDRETVKKHVEYLIRKGKK